MGRGVQRHGPIRRYAGAAAHVIRGQVTYAPLRHANLEKRKPPEMVPDHNGIRPCLASPGRIALGSPILLHRHPTFHDLVTEDQVFDFARETIKSVWALELLLLLHRDAGRAWSSEELVRELRSSDAVINPCLDGLKAAGLVVAEPEGRFRYAAANPHLDAIAGELARIYAVRPMAIAKAIMRAPNEKLRIFSDAFKLKD